MLKKIYIALLIIVITAILLLAGRICQIFFDWPEGSMYLWPVVAFLGWGSFVLLRKAWIKYQAAQRLKTQLPIEELASPDPDWKEGVQHLLRAQHNQDKHFLTLDDIQLSEDLPRLKASIEWLDARIVEMLNGNRLRSLSDVGFIHQLLVKAHNMLVGVLERNQIEFINHIPGLANLLGKKHQYDSGLGAHPIHFVLGLPGSGKSTFIQRSSIGAQIGNTNPDAVITPTNSCRLAYLTAGIMVEISGRHVDPGRSADESDADWNSLLANMTVDIHPPQITSVIVCVSADELGEDQANKVNEGVQMIRRRINDLMALSGKRLAVYIVLTKIDLMGMSPLLQNLPMSILAQPAGSLNPSENIDITANNVAESINEINRYIPWLALRSAASGYSPKNSALDAVSSMLDVQESLATIVTNLFIASSYLQAPIYRGLFLSADLEKAGVIFDRQSSNPRLAFGSGVINDILLRDRVFQPLSSFERALRHRQRMAWLGYYAAVGGLLVWLTAGYFYQAQQMSRLKDAGMPATAVKADPTEIFVQSVVDMEPFVKWSLNRDLSSLNFLLPFSPVTNEIEKKIQIRFIRNHESFEQNFLASKFIAVYDTYGQGNNSLIGPTIDSMLGRIRIIEAALAGDSLQKLRMLPAPDTAAITFLYPDIPIAEIEKINEFFSYYIYWSIKDRDVTTLLSEGKRFLEYVAQKDKKLDWLLSWSQTQPNVVAVRLSDYWSPVSKPQGIDVPAPYTINGLRAITQFITRIQNNPELKKIYGDQIAPFMSKYHTDRENTWRSFVLGFADGKNLLLDEASWVAVISTLNGSESPYVKLTERLLAEYPTEGAISLQPGWITSLDFVQTVQNAALENSIMGSFFGKLEVLAKAFKLNNSSDRAQERDLAEDHVLYSTFIKAFNKVLSSALSSSGEAATLAINYSGLGTGPSIQVSALSDATSALQRFQDKIGVKSQPWNQPVWAILEGPLNTTTAYAYKQAACKLQSTWNSDVIYPSKLATTESEIYEKTFGDQGTLWSFVDKNAQAFLTSNGSDFESRKVNNFSMNWQDTFISFLNSAANEKRIRDAAVKKAELEDKLDNTKDNARIKEINDRIPEIEKDQALFNQTNFSVKVDGLPVQANSAVKTLPYGMSVTLSCGANQQRLTQLNFTNSQIFNWKANSCGDAELQIYVGNLILSKVWSGEYGFSQFLKVFKTGKKTFLASNFPDQTAALDALGVKQIDVFFRLTGASTFVAAAEKYQAETVELAKIKAEKAKLEKALADRQVKKITAQLEALAGRQQKLVVPTTVAICPY